MRLKEDFEIEYGIAEMPASFIASCGRGDQLLLFMYRTLSLFGINRFRPVSSIDLGISKKFKNGGRLRLSGSDIFFQRYLGISSTNNPDLIFNTTIKDESRVYRLSYTQSFGSNKRKRMLHNNTTDEVKGRFK